MSLNNIKALMFDLDGTLINRQKQMSDKVILALKRLKAKGYILATNTGRPTFAIEKILKNNGVYECFDYLFAYNGNEVSDLKSGQRKITKPITSEYLKEIDDFFTEDYATCTFYSEDNTILYYNHDISNQDLFKEWNTYRYTTPIKVNFQNFDAKIAKLMFLFEVEHTSDLLAKVNDFPDKRLDFSKSNKDCMEIMPQGISKGKAVEDFAQILNINNKDILLFGDEESDVPGLIKATGCLVGNAIKIGERKIDYQCADINNDGVYHFLCEQGLIEY